MEVVFLDANILFSACWKELSGIQKIWELKNISLITSEYALEEARRNLPTTEQKKRLSLFLEKVQVVSHVEDILPESIDLREKDRPILSAAIVCKADILLTGDKRDFGIFFEQTVFGVTILPPVLYFQRNGVV
jgi:predicted nucleic acid-binding protein